jgi:anti-sigma factor RsiW
MLCSRVQNQLSAYCDREMTGAEMIEVRRHLDRCGPCRAEFDSLQQVRALLGALPEVEPARAFDPAVLTAPRPSRWGLLARAYGSRLRFHWDELRAAWSFGPAAGQRALACAAIVAAFLGGGISTTLLRPSQPADAVTANVPPVPAEELPVSLAPAGMNLHLAHAGLEGAVPGTPPVVYLTSAPIVQEEPVFPGLSEPYPPRPRGLHSAELAVYSVAFPR